MVLAVVDAAAARADSLEPGGIESVTADPSVSSPLVAATVLEESSEAGDRDGDLSRE